MYVVHDFILLFLRLPLGEVNRWWWWL